VVSLHAPDRIGAKPVDCLASRGLDVATIDVSELAKAEGGVTCCSLILEDVAYGHSLA
jgi:N-dimethylarginine dimethylaminohydrolase